MASGHVNRTQRPNTWLHRPSLRREESPCQLGAVHTWPIATNFTLRPDVSFRGKSGSAVYVGGRGFLGGVMIDETAPDDEREHAVVFNLFT